MDLSESKSRKSLKNYPMPLEAMISFLQTYEPSPSFNLLNQKFPETIGEHEICRVVHMGHKSSINFRKSWQIFSIIWIQIQTSSFICPCVQALSSRRRHRIIISLQRSRIVIHLFALLYGKSWWIGATIGYFICSCKLILMITREIPAV